LLTMSSFDYGEKRPDGQYERYPSLPDGARQPAQFVRPVRDSYRHVGRRPVGKTRPVTEDDDRRFDAKAHGYVLFEEYEPSEQRGIGRFWTQAQLNSGCGTVTRMGRVLAETYAARPGYYGATFCSRCGNHFPVGAAGEFVWIEADGSDGPRVGT
jgi:hypothetical protein